ncbi:MAG: metal-dependent transcriptional regulator [Candidatus Aminicenantes bacterium]|nr:MAG: metal-dependent transcriptional regulator [Candidatus Aminicenantes bacterium]
MVKKKLSPSLEDYLEAIYVVAQNKKIVRVKDLIKMLDVKTASVIGALKKLEERGLVEHEHYGYIDLTPEGEKKAAAIYEKHTVLLRFLNEFLNVDEEIAERDACKMEHCISDETFSKISRLTRILETAREKNPSWFAELKAYMNTNVNKND